MKFIYKYPFDLTSEISISMPVDSIILDVREQSGVLCMWVLVQVIENQKFITRNFLMFSTGENFSGVEHESYLCTVHLEKPKEVYHIFEIL